MFKNCFKIFVYIIAAGLQLTASGAFAQKVLKLSEVEKFELLTREGGLSNALRKLEVIKEDVGWKCYQTQFRNNSGVNDVSRKFVKDVPDTILVQLLDIITKQDTGVNVDLFKINEIELTRYIDSLRVSFKAEQRAEFSEKLKSKSVIKEGLEKALIPFMMDDRTYYGITITTKSNGRLTIEAHSFADLYYLPWTINNIKSYDPNISTIFEFIGDSKGFPVWEKNQLYLRVIRNIYQTNFKTRFNWSNLKSDQPVLFRILGNTLAPINFSEVNGGFLIYFSSSLLPSYVQLRTYFKPQDSLSVQRIKNYEDTLVNVFKKDNFLFSYLRTRPEGKVILTPGKMGDSGKDYFRDLRKYFIGIDTYDYKQTQLLEVYGSEDIRSRWILLPDNSLILLQYPGTTERNNSIQFMNIDPIMLGLQNSFLNAVCIVFDSSGKVIKNYGKAAIGEY